MAELHRQGDHTGVTPLMIVNTGLRMVRTSLVIGALVISLTLEVQGWAAETPTPKPGSDMAPLGSLEFSPSSQHPIGWRGDGSGRYPAADPPLHWGRESVAVSALRCQAAKPKEGETGHQDIMASSPVFEGRRLYFRTDGYVYCIEEKQ